MTEYTDVRTNPLFDSSREIGELAAALAKAQGEMPAVKKGSDNPFFKSKYADLADIMSTVTPVLSKHGLAVVQLVSHRDAVNVLKTVLTHASGQWIADESIVYNEKNTPQAQGSAITYARRYALSAIVGVSTEDDDDGNAATGHQAPQATTKRSPTRPPATHQAPEAQPPARDSGEQNPNLITVKQMNMLRAILAGGGITDNGDVHDTVGAWIGRSIESTKELTKAEASIAIDAAKAWQSSQTGSIAQDQPF